VKLMPYSDPSAILPTYHALSAEKSIRATEWPSVLKPMN
jgi:hypothetical protein